jgi:hypothetical protein
MELTPTPSDVTPEEEELCSLSDWKTENEKAMAISGYPAPELIEQNRAIKRKLKEAHARQNSA